MDKILELIFKAFEQCLEDQKKTKNLAQRKQVSLLKALELCLSVQNDKRITIEKILKIKIETDNPFVIREAGRQLRAAELELAEAKQLQKDLQMRFTQHQINIDLDKIGLENMKDWSGLLNLKLIWDPKRGYPEDFIKIEKIDQREIQWTKAEWFADLFGGGDPELAWLREEITRPGKNDAEWLRLTLYNTGDYYWDTPENSPAPNESETKAAPDESEKEVDLAELFEEMQKSFDLELLGEMLKTLGYIAYLDQWGWISMDGIPLDPNLNLNLEFIKILNWEILEWAEWFKSLYLPENRNLGWLRKELNKPRKNNSEWIRQTFFVRKSGSNYWENSEDDTPTNESEREINLVWLGEIVKMLENNEYIQAWEHRNTAHKVPKNFNSNETEKK